MSDDEYRLPTYPVVRFLVERGKPLSIAIGLATFLAGAWLAWTGAGALWAVAGLVGGAVLGALLASYVEVLAIISDTLIPK